MTIPLDRYATAAELALLLFQAESPGGAPGGLPDIDVYDATVNDNGTWALEGDDTPDDTFADAVFLAEGTKGADALAIGPVAAAYSSPVLLTRSAELPVATLAALTVMNPRSIITVGGEAAVSQDVLDAAVSAAGETGDFTPDVLRVAGPDRYSTSVGVAAVLAGVQFGDTGTLFGFARSDRNDGTDAVDALAGAAFVDNVGLAGVSAPTRQAPPIERNGALGGDLRGPNTIIGGSTFQPGGIVPILLVKPGTATASGLSNAVATYLADLYPDPTSTSENPTGNQGGFGYVFGGTAAISAGTEQAIGTLLSGGTYAPAQIDSDLVRYNGATDINPSATVNDIFFTDLGFGLIALTGGASNDGGGVDLNQSTPAGLPIGPKICVYRDGLLGVARIAAYTPAGGFIRSVPVDYQNKAASPVANNPNSVWTPFQSRFMCVDASGAFTQPGGPGTPWFGGMVVRFQSLSGNEAQSNGKAVTNVQQQLALGTAAIPPPPGPLTWCYAPLGPGEVCSQTVSYPLPPGSLTAGPVAGSAVLANFRGIPLTGLERGRLDLTVTRRGIPGAPSANQNAATLTGRLVIDPVAGSAFPGGLTINIKAETDLPNDPGLVPFQDFSGMYSVGPAGSGPTGGLIILLNWPPIVPGVTPPPPVIFLMSMTGNA
ncbi:MAG: cell wall-binding repeat-containing protein [Acidimicrobiales bacterium]|nr:cell wall-binding repeat-containing protein [Acidimicrobiales bacterium]